MSVLSRWPCNISNHLSSRSVIVGVCLFPLAIQYFYSYFFFFKSVVIGIRFFRHTPFLFISFPHLLLVVAALFRWHFYSFVSQIYHYWCLPFSVGHVALLWIYFPDLSPLVSVLFRWSYSISKHLFARSIIVVIYPFSLIMQYFYSFISQIYLFHWSCNISIHIFFFSNLSLLVFGFSAILHFYSFLSRIYY